MSSSLRRRYSPSTSRRKAAWRFWNCSAAPPVCCARRRNFCCRWPKRCSRTWRCWTRCARSLMKSCAPWAARRFYGRPAALTPPLRRATGYGRCCSHPTPTCLCRRRRRATRRSTAACCGRCCEACSRAPAEPSAAAERAAARSKIKLPPALPCAGGFRLFSD